MTSLASSAGRDSAAAEADARHAVRRRADGAAEISEIWRILWRRRLTIMGVAGGLALLALLYGLLTPALYTASAQILVDPRDRNVVSNDVNPNAVSPDGGIAQVESQVSVAQSTGVLVRAIRAVKLTEDDEFAPRGLLASLFGFADRDPPSAIGGLSPVEARALANLRRKMSVRRADKVLVIDVVVTTRGAEKSALVANAIAEAYLTDQAEARSRGAREASEALTARLAEQRRRVETAENAVERYRAENNLVASSGRLITDQQLGEVSAQHSAAQARTAALRAQVEQLALQRREGALAGATAEALQSTVISRLREQEAVLVQREAEMQSQLGPLHPQIVAARGQIDRTRQLIATEIRRVDQSLRRDFDRALANEKLLAGKLEAMTRQTQGSDQASVRLRDLQRDLEAARSVYASFLLRAQETREQASVDATNARVISRAQPPLRKSWPPLGLLLAGAACLGLGLGAGGALIAEYAAPHLLSTRQAETVIGAPVVGVLPRARAGASPEGGEAPDIGVAGLALLRLMDSAGGRTARAHAILLVSAEVDADERRRAAALLAEAAALRGEEVLLIDADIARDASDDRRGLLDVLRGDCRFEAGVEAGRGDVAVMPRGRSSGGPQAGSGRGAALRLLADAGRHFDLVVVDGGAPMRNVKLAPLVDTADQVVLVTRLQETRQSDIAAVVEAVGVMGRAVDAALLVDPHRKA